MPHLCPAAARRKQGQSRGLRELVVALSFTETESLHLKLGSAADNALQEIVKASAALG